MNNDEDILVPKITKPLRVFYLNLQGGGMKLQNGRKIPCSCKTPGVLAI